MATGDGLAAIRQMLKPAWTNQPAEPGYDAHWNTHRPAGEQVLQVFPGVARGNAVVPARQMVNVVRTDRNIYIDTPKVERVGPVARFAGQVLDRGGFSEPLQAPLQQAVIRQTDSRHVSIEGPGLPPVRARTDAFIGRPSELSPGAQVKNLWATLRG